VNAYNEGFEAYERGDNEINNPYTQKVDHEAWLEGWWSAEQEYEKYYPEEI